MKSYKPYIWTLLIAMAAWVACGDASSDPTGVLDENIDSHTLALEEVTGDHPQCGIRPPIMEEADLNGDGVLDEEERIAFHEAHRAEILAEYDLDDSGDLDEDERQLVRDAKRAQRFAEMDANADGQLTIDEVIEGCPLAVHFDELDADGNGGVTLEEFAAAPAGPHPPQRPGGRYEGGPNGNRPDGPPNGDNPDGPPPTDGPPRDGNQPILTD